MLNNKGQAVFLGIMVFVMVFIVMVQFITPIKNQISEARASDKLDCTNSSISVGVKGTCVIVDWYLPYFMGVVIAGGAGFMTNRAARGFR